MVPGIDLKKNGKCSFVVSGRKKCVMESRQGRAYKMCGWQVEILVD